MISSSQRSIFRLGFLLLGLALTACLPKPQERPEGTANDAANFAVASMSGSVAASRNVGEFPLPGEKTYNFKACLIDYTRMTNIPNAKFRIDEIEQDFTTDAQGCLNWPEVIKFNYLSDSVWLKMTRTLKPKGLQRGTREVKFAINPWSHGEGLADVMDLTKQTTPYLVEKTEDVKARLEGKDKDGQLKKRTVWIENGERNVTNGKLQGAAYTWHDQIFLRPQILFEKTDATPVLVPILHGSFKVEITLISEDVQNQKTTRMVWGKQTVEKVSIANNTLMIDADFSLQSGPTSGQTMLGIKLIPLGAPEGLQPFEGIFPLGSSHSFTESGGLKISETVAKENRTGQFSLQKFLGGNGTTTIQGIGGAGSSAHAQTAGVYAGYISADDFKVSSESQLRKTLSFRAHYCLSDKVGKFGLTNRKFILHTLDGAGKVLKTESVSTETLPCIYWESRTPEFDRNECYHYIKMSFRLQNADLGLDQTESLLINPWMEKAVDKRHAKDMSQYPMSCDAQEGKLKTHNIIFPGSMMMIRESYRPEVLDRSLQMTQRAVFTIQLNGPGKAEPSNENSGRTPSLKPLEFGKYLLRLAFVRDAKARPDNGYVGHANVIMSSLPNGSLQGQMDMQIKDLQSTLVRKMVLAQLFPIDEEKLKQKDWKGNDPEIDQLIDRKTKLVSPIYSSKSVVLGNPGGPVFLKPGFENNDGLPNMIANQLKQNSQNETLIPEIVRIGEAAQNAMIAKNAFKENDPKSWEAWAKDQNMTLVRMNDQKAVTQVAQQLGLQGDVKATLQSLIDMDRLDAKWAIRFCQVLRDGPWKELFVKNKPVKGFTAGSLFTSTDPRKTFMNACESMVRKNPMAFFKKNSVYQILEMRPGLMNPTKLAVSGLSVSSGFGYSAGHTDLQGVQGGLSLSAGANLPFAKILSAGLGASYGPVMMSTEDRNRHSGQDVGTSMSLGVTRWQFDIPVLAYQKCTLLRANPEVFVYQPETSYFLRWMMDNDRNRLRNAINNEASFSPYREDNPLFAGWMICSDQKITKPVLLTESYFMVSQGNGDSETYDSADEVNRRFFLPIRGNSDMSRFKSVLCDTRTYPKFGEVTDELQSDLAVLLSPVIRRFDPAPGMILYDPAFEPPQLPANETPWEPKSEKDVH
jgi:hypothetical protein